ncbi:MAG: TIGR03905 family TSCPD domain-containing protein [Muribaculaceae bacterium]|nr:TIGR03905 family TSCPD domain-containing protein [Muribaculaceae bacterium]
MKYTYYTSGTCSSQIDLDVDDQHVVRDVQFYGGCHGNLQGISTLVRGMSASEVISKLQGIRCGYKNTSCPDQLANALREVLAQK